MKPCPHVPPAKLSIARFDEYGWRCAQCWCHPSPCRFPCTAGYLQGNSHFGRARSIPERRTRPRNPPIHAQNCLIIGAGKIAPEVRVFHCAPMPRPRTLDPIGASDHPNIVDDPKRQAAILARFIDRTRYLGQAYMVTKSAARSDRLEFNESLTRLKGQLARVDRGEDVEFERAPSNRLHPELELLINWEARKRAGLSPSALLRPTDQRHIMAAARHIASTHSARRGRPSPKLFKLYLEGLVAAWIEATGKPVVGPRTKGSVYNPHLTGASGKVIRTFADQLEPGITDTALVMMLGQIRRKYAGKPMRFSDLFPLYGGKVVEGVPYPGPGHKLESFIPIFPIYCP